MSLDRILKLGHPLLYQKAEAVRQDEIPSLLSDIAALHDLVLEFRKTYGAGRAIAAPQIGLMKRIICYNHTTKQTIINPTLLHPSEEMMELWDDCMSFPNLLVKLKRHKHITMKFMDEHWNEHEWHLSDDLSELMQHEYDHLEGILATMRAVDGQSFKMI